MGAGDDIHLNASLFLCPNNHRSIYGLSAGLGGHITHSGVPRVNGVLAVSRAIGDKNYKPFLISDPEQRSGRPFHFQKKEAWMSQVG